MNDVSLRPSVAAFAAAMEQLLRDLEATDGAWPGDDDMVTLFTALDQEVHDLQMSELAARRDKWEPRGHVHDPHLLGEVMDDAVGVAIFALTVAYICGALPRVEEQLEVPV